ncbi:ABC transporter permease [Engelhardtia mirabilis]|uniref:ABC-2 family transporter protein n=1 Tax=Engelhardtia mirabilis TaxID=2528011 RepID=A0A518BMA5_9BACT|nr:ABC-2 family transporter protein [Planctomycetes bacterium Pla133]QDV02435.1 ABC-2 family transporter protein [Planctomycetes bacterium Pla86]
MSATTDSRPLSVPRPERATPADRPERAAASTPRLPATVGRPLLAVFRREFASYFATPLAATFLVIFLFLTGAFTFQLGGLYERGQADLRPFFGYLPWLYLFLVPAIAMRLWAEERRIGTVELLVTLPVRLSDLVLGKFLAAWAFACVALALTFPLWMTVSYLGDPDHGVILASYLGAALMAGSFLAVGSCLSALSKNQVVAFVVCVVVCLGLLLSGFPLVLGFLSGWAPEFVVDSVAGLSLLTHFEALQRGVVDLRDVLYFLAVMAGALFLNVLVLDWKKAD